MIVCVYSVSANTVRQVWRLLLTDGSWYVSGVQLRTED
jgi:hypothetical protein